MAWSSQQKKALVLHELSDLIAARHPAEPEALVRQAMHQAEADPELPLSEVFQTTLTLHHHRTALWWVNQGLPLADITLMLPELMQAEPNAEAITVWEALVARPEFHTPWPNAYNPWSRLAEAHAPSPLSAEHLTVWADRLADLGHDINTSDEQYGLPPIFTTTAPQLLVAHGARLDVVGPEGQLPLHQALRDRRNTAAWELLALGADPLARDGQGRTALHAAFACDGEELDYRATNNRGLNGWVGQPNAPLIRALIERGVDPEARDEEGYLPVQLGLGIALSNGWVAEAQALLQPEWEAVKALRRAEALAQTLDEALTPTSTQVHRPRL